LASPLDIISSRPWDAALFTTYALSLTFFESVVLRSLRQRNCREIWVVVDADGYQRSLMERQSSHIGQEYWLIPVALPNGVFHCKCTYLAGPEGDLLLVGSGNLTFGGYGRNLEVLEVLTPEEEPTTFEAFAEFLEALRYRPDFRCPNLTWVTWFATRARDSVRRISPKPRARQPRLIHSTTRPVLDALKEAVASMPKEFAGPRELIVLSPFHDADGEAVREAVRATGSNRIAVGLPTRQDEPSMFPFFEAKSWELPIRAVTPAVSSPDRSLHAKCIEVAAADARIILTGSINSTRNALVSTKNIEAGILRIASPPVFRWEAAEIPARVARLDRDVPGLREKLLIHAVLGADGTLSGQLLAAHDPSGVWTGRLLLPDARSTPLVVRVDATGLFGAPVDKHETFSFATSLQIELRFGDRLARGWVHQDELLRMPRLQGLGVTALVRLIARDATDDDAVALLDYLAGSATRHSDVFLRTIRPESLAVAKQVVEVEQDTSIDLSKLAPTTDAPPAAIHPFFNVSTASALERVFARIRSSLLDLGGSHDPPIALSPSQENADADSGDEQTELSRRRKRIEKALEYFEDRMNSLTMEVQDERQRSGLLVIWLEAKEDMLLVRRRDPGAALEFLRTWFRRACDRVSKQVDVTALEEHIVAAAALQAAREADEQARERLCSRLGEALERFSGGLVDVARAVACLKEGASTRFIRALNEGGRDLESALRQILSSKTIRAQLQECLDLAQQRKSIPADCAIFSGEAGAAFRRILNRADWENRVAEMQGDESACAHCHMVLTPMGEMGLRTRRFAQCASCGKVTVRLRP